MEVKYTHIRLGSKRKDSFKERELSRSVKSLKEEITETLNEEYHGEIKKIQLTIIKLSCGLKAKFNMDNIKNSEIRKILSSNFGASIRKLSEEEILLNNL